MTTQTRPPRPAEPTALGAVIEDAQGQRWIRTSSGPGYNWQADADPHWGAHWHNLAAPRVLHEGWNAATARELLTEDERDAIRLTVELANTLGRIVDVGASRQSDMHELVAPLHVIQRAVMAQAAAREYPGEFRLLGGVIDGAIT